MINEFFSFIYTHIYLAGVDAGFGLLVCAISCLKKPIFHYYVISKLSLNRLQCGYNIHVCYIHNDLLLVCSVSIYDISPEFTLIFDETCIGCSLLESLAKSSSWFQSSYRERSNSQSLHPEPLSPRATASRFAKPYDSF
jgi:hypothetical protein